MNIYKLCICIVFSALLSSCQVSAKIRGREDEKQRKTQTKILSNGSILPLVGVGVGNLAHDQIPSTVENFIQKGGRLIDTARASRNEHIISKAIGQASSSASGDRVIHVVTKVWYTHLGYERTKYSIEESLKDLSVGNQDMDVQVHLLLHWPRCNDEIEWMNCKQEEEQLSPSIKSLGPPPHLNYNAWKESWKAMEEAYEKSQELKRSEKGKMKQVLIESIGVSNFEMEDMRALLSESSIKPHLYQGNVWKVVHDPKLMDLLERYNVTFQAYNVMNGVIGQHDSAPNAYTILSSIGGTLMQMDTTIKRKITASMVVNAWLVQQGISIIPRASSSHHKDENLPSSIEIVPQLNEEQNQQIVKAVSALMRGQDVTVSATFQNDSQRHVQLHWIDGRNGEEFPVTEMVAPNSKASIQSHPGHKFVAYDGKKIFRQEFTVTASYGKEQHFTVQEEL
ncbi:hypothetical protein CTEN210_06599 [Chaetoceros tenuissimus]|uniref:NADP-dependent oxidoreductase domain-containing protein n=1 Tax=Chaetoceros tenuissimus TaxID=426638 RepID=A0AAD3CQ65_9STRA|nr:hypothetical protein CTEN210_06599 [Chaetoceros tenuissimus]